MLPEPMRDADALVDAAVSRARAILTDADRLRDRRSRYNQRRFERLLKDPDAVAVTMALTDEVMRISDPSRATRALRRAAGKASNRGLGVKDANGVKFIAALSPLLPRFVMRIVEWQVRAAATGIILPAEEKPLAAHLQKRKAEGVRLNVNVLGEAVLGDGEATHRLNSIIEMVQRTDVTYASVKVSGVVSQLNTIDHDGSVQRVAARLRQLYSVANAAGTFINLDMEEYRDLGITVDVFKRVLSEPEFGSMDAGIVLQAYLPEAHAAFTDLADWAKWRHERLGGRIKVRLVKGANLAMETTEAELHGWVGAPYGSKSDVDASYKRLVDAALRPEVAGAVRIGIASHNLFDIAWALEVAKARGVEAQLDIEMLEGMANGEALAIAHQIGGVLLYTPVTRHDDFASAVAYLVRRLDENTSPENYLRASFGMSPDSKAFEEQAQRFRSSVDERHTIPTTSRRHLMVRHDAGVLAEQGVFENQADGDLTHPEYRRGLEEALATHRRGWVLPLPLAIEGEQLVTADQVVGVDPGDNGREWYRYSVASPEDVDRAVAVAQAAVPAWDGRGSAARRRVLFEAARRMEADRVNTVAVMMLDSGKTAAEADPEISEAIDFARYYGLSARSSISGSDSTPVGVVAVVPPWNFPYAIPCGGVCAALAAGNAVILKPAPETVATAWMLVQQLWAAGVPQDVLQFVPTRDDESGQRLITHAGVDAVILTGGFATAELFTGWRPDIRLLAETSGKNALLVAGSADIDAAVKDLVSSAFGHAGQKCSAASLAIVEATIYDNPAFMRQLQDSVETLNVGAGWDYSTVVGPVIRPPEGALWRALTQLDEGESWLVEPRQRDEAGHLWSPGVKLGVKPGSWSHRNEWFGPVLGVMRAPDFETAINWQNDVDYGLTAGIHALDVEECEHWIDRVEAGNAYVNRGTTGAVVNRQPFGGWKRSAVGPTSKAGGPHYVQQLRDWLPFTEVERSIHQAEEWWQTTGSLCVDHSGLKVERNIHRYRVLAKGIEVRVPAEVTAETLEYIDAIRRITRAPITLSCAAPLPGDLHCTIEDPATFTARVTTERVRVLSDEQVDAAALLARGISVDRRPLAANGAVELPRWLHEQSVSITNHRYGNVGSGPHPAVH